MLTHSSPQQLTRRERIDLRISRSLPKASGRGNRRIFRLTGGRLGSSARGIPIGLLTTTGRRSGRPRRVALMYLKDGDRYLLVGSNSGYDSPPAWLLNLQAEPAALFEPKGKSLAVRARPVDRDEHALLWPRLVAHNPLWGAFQTYTDRHTTVVALEPVLEERG